MYIKERKKERKKESKTNVLLLTLIMPAPAFKADAATDASKVSTCQHIPSMPLSLCASVRACERACVRVRVDNYVQTRLCW